MCKPSYAMQKIKDFMKLTWYIEFATAKSPNTLVALSLGCSDFISSW